VRSAPGCANCRGCEGVPQAAGLPEAPALQWRDRRRLAKKRARAIEYSRGKAKRRRLYRELIAATRATQAALYEASKRLADLAGTAAQRWRAQFDHYRPLIERILAQSQRRVLDGQVVPASEKLVSLFEPHADMIVKGARDVQYGHKLNLVTGRSGLILPSPGQYSTNTIRCWAEPYPPDMTEIPAVSVACSATTLVFQIDSLPTDLGPILSPCSGSVLVHGVDPEFFLLPPPPDWPPEQAPAVIHRRDAHPSFDCPRLSNPHTTKHRLLRSERKIKVPAWWIAGPVRLRRVVQLVQTPDHLLQFNGPMNERVQLGTYRCCPRALTQLVNSHAGLA
jgi:hypothetical protein